MKRDLDQAIKDLDGKPFVDKSTLKTLCFSAVAQTLQGDEGLSIDVKMKQFELLKKINAGGVVDLSSEDITLMKDRARRFFPIVPFGVFCELLEQEYKEPTHLEAVKG